MYINKKKIIVIFVVDPRAKGFSKDGIFKSDSYRSYYSLSNVAERSKENEILKIHYLVGILISYALATNTTFFGTKFNRNWKDLYSNDNFVFIAQLAAKNRGIFTSNVFTFIEVKYTTARKFGKL